jgi:hypothetical protein
LQLKTSRVQLERRLANLPSYLIGMEATYLGKRTMTQLKIMKNVSSLVRLALVLAPILRPSSLPFPPPDAAVQERVPLRATLTERFSNESDDLLVGVVY